MMTTTIFLTIRSIASHLKESLLLRQKTLLQTLDLYSKMMPGRGSSGAPSERTSASSKLFSALTGSLKNAHGDKNKNNRTNQNERQASSSSLLSSSSLMSYTPTGSSQHGGSSRRGGDDPHDLSHSCSTSAAFISDPVAVKWHLKLKECERGRKATVEAKLIAIRDHLNALMQLTTAAHQETAAIHRFLLGMVLAQEQMAEALKLPEGLRTTYSAATAESEEKSGEENSDEAKSEASGRTDQPAGSSSSPTSVASSKATGLLPTESLEQSNELMEQKLQVCSADIRQDLLSSDANTGGIGLLSLLSTQQRQIQDLRKGQDYADQLEDLQKRIQKAWGELSNVKVMHVPLAKNPFGLFSLTLLVCCVPFLSDRRLPHSSKRIFGSRWRIQTK